MIIAKAESFRTKKPWWLKVPVPSGSGYYRVRKILREKRLHTICEEGNCPNRAECFGRGTATFLLLGRVCTRHCLYCNVECRYPPEEVDSGEVERVVQAVRELGLHYVVITSVTRDDLPDGGASIFAAVVKRLKEEFPSLRVEVLVPDFAGREEDLNKVIEAGPQVINHNVECTSSVFSQLRPQGNYRRSLDLLRRVSEAGVRAKSGFMVGLGESWDDVVDTLRDLLSVNCRWVTIGQYQQPTRYHWPVYKFYEPEEFSRLEEIARSLGFEAVASGPLVRSSYRAGLYGSKEEMV